MCHSQNSDFQNPSNLCQSKNNRFQMSLFLPTPLPPLSDLLFARPPKIIHICMDSIVVHDLCNQCILIYLIPKQLRYHIGQMKKTSVLNGYFSKIKLSWVDFFVEKLISEGRGRRRRLLLPQCAALPPSHSRTPMS